MNTDRGDTMAVEANLIKAVFLAALEKDTPTDRAVYLDEVCAQDPALRQRVEMLLRTHDAPSRLLDQPAMQLLAAQEDAAALDFLEPAEKAGVLGRLGHYEVRDIVGRG